MITGHFKFYKEEPSLILVAYLLSLHANCFEILKTLMKDCWDIWWFYEVENIDDVLSNIWSENSLVKVIKLALHYNETEIAVWATEDLIH